MRSRQAVTAVDLDIIKVSMRTASMSRKSLVSMMLNTDRWLKHCWSCYSCIGNPEEDAWDWRY